MIDNLPIAKNLEELNDEKQDEFEKLADDYSMALQLMNLFIEVNGLDYDDTWDRANQKYDEDMTYAPNED
ncbi:hypothetical protein [Niallia taxi]|uniref:hypothetical protein n=1 Tax=Niallia taxi TaxID=2499688 RepID=UPI00300B43BD